MVVLRFSAPFGAVHDLFSGSTYDDLFRLIGKRLWNFLFVLIVLFR